MRLKNYKADLHRRLRDPESAAEYPAQVLAEDDNAAFLIALKDVVEAGGGIGHLADRVGLKRKSLQDSLQKRQSHLSHIARNFETIGNACLSGSK